LIADNTGSIKRNNVEKILQEFIRFSTSGKTEQTNPLRYRLKMLEYQSHYAQSSLIGSGFEGERIITHPADCTFPQLRRSRGMVFSKPDNEKNSGDYFKEVNQPGPGR